jgi:pilus assembly protein Flp/PilA
MLRGAVMYRKFGSDRSGATAIEYGLIAGLITLAIFGGVGSLGQVVQIMWLENSSTVVEHLK